MTSSFHCRFYNNQSSFVHGGLDASNKEVNPVVGQKQIHQKIQQLDFRDCHAKIAQVDSQSTLGEGVVVQVYIVIIYFLYSSIKSLLYLHNIL